MRSAYEILERYQHRSLAHAARLPGQSFADGVWRGVGYRVGARRWVSDFRDVVEIMTMPPVTAVPGTQPWLLGIAHQRGSLFPLVDLKQFLDHQPSAPHQGQRVLKVLQHGGGEVALIVDELYGQRSFTPAQEIAAGALAEGRCAPFVERAFDDDGQIWGVLSLSRLSRHPEFRQAAA